MALVDTPVSLHAADAPTSTDVAALYAAHHRWLINWLQRRMAGSVSYTHLTLPTKA